MCGHCGCGDKTGATILNLQTGKEIAMGGDSTIMCTMHAPWSRPRDHDHGHDHASHHEHDHVHDA